MKTIGYIIFGGIILVAALQLNAFIDAKHLQAATSRIQQEVSVQQLRTKQAEINQYIESHRNK